MDTGFSFRCLCLGTVCSVIRVWFLGRKNIRMFVSVHLQRSTLGPTSHLVPVRVDLKILVIFWIHFILSFWGWFQFKVPTEDEKVASEFAYSWCNSLFIWVPSYPIPGSLLIFPLLFSTGCSSFELPFLMQRVSDQENSVSLVRARPPT